MPSFIRFGAAIATALFALTACGGGSSTPGFFAPAPTASPTAAPIAPVSGSPITHVIVIVQENRTVDNLFSSSALTGGGPYPGANVVTTWQPPAPVAPQPLAQVPFEAPFDPDHSHVGLVAEYQALAAGSTGGFYTNKVTTVPPFPTPANGAVLAQVPYVETILYHTLASTYGLADNMYSSALAPSFPGHLYLIAGKSDPSDDPTDNNIWGCDSAAGTTVPVFSDNGGINQTTPGVFPCFDYQTLGDLMDSAHVTWKYYTGQVGNTVDGQVNTYDAIRHIRNGPDWTTNISTPTTNVLSDIQNCSLPNVSWVTPPALASDHAANLSNGGPGWVGSIYLAVAESAALQKNAACQYYGNTAILLTWDDSGGWYDHVVPPVVNGHQWGFRVPLIVASPWAVHGSPIPFVSHKQRDFGSILRFIEKNWSLPSLGAEDATADDLSDMFNYAQSPVPPLTTAAVRSMMDRTMWNRVKNIHTNMPVDDDK